MNGLILVLQSRDKISMEIGEFDFNSRVNDKKNKTQKYEVTTQKME